MIKPLLVSTLCAFCAVSTLAADSGDVTGLPAPVRHTIDQYKGGGEVKKVTPFTQNGTTVYQVEFKGKSKQKAVVIGQDGSVISDESARPGQGAKGKGKAKGKYKNRGNGQERDEDDQGESGGAPSKAVRPSPRTAETAHPPAPTSPTPTVSTPPAPAQNSTRPASSTTTPVPPKPAESATASIPPKPALSAKEVKAQFNHHFQAINSMDKNTRAVQAGLKVVSEETGVPLATVQEQRKAYALGAGGLLVANELSKATQKPAKTFLAQRVKGAEWTAIVAANKVELDPLLPKLDRVEQAMTAAKAAK